MGKILAPRISTADRSGLTLDLAEFVFDTDTESYWYGDGSTAGGIELGIATPSFYGTSVTNLTIGGGVQSLVTQSGLAYTVGMRARVLHASGYYMEGEITAYSGTAMDVTVDFKVGSGAFNTWVLSPASEIIVPDGGSTGDVLTKASSSDYDVSWVAPSGGGGGGDVLQVQIFS